MVPLGINIRPEFGLSLPDQIGLLASIGFDAFFLADLGDDEELYADCRRAADDHGVTWETIHAPYSSREGGMNTMWLEGQAGDRFLDTLLRCVDRCAENGVGLMVCHTSYTNVIPDPTELGGRRFDRLVDHAASSGIKIAFENLEYAAPLRFVLDRYRGNSTAGLCWDIGHGSCNTPGHDVMGEFGDRLLCLHIHDNLGKRREGRPSYDDDLHLIPFDGTIDFAEAGRKLRAAPAFPSLMLEVKLMTYLKRGVAPAELAPGHFLRKAYRRARRLAEVMGVGETLI